MSNEVKPATTYPAIVSRILQRERETQGLSQGDVAHIMGVTQGTWSRIENGSSMISLDQLHAVAKYLDRTPSEILALADTAEESLRGQGVEIIAARSTIPGAAVMTGAALGALLAVFLVKRGG